MLARRTRGTTRGKTLPWRMFLKEHLAGRYLDKHCNARQIAGYLGREWWRETLLFHAGQQENITDIIETCDMLHYAPYTDDTAIDILIQAKKDVSPAGRIEGEPR